MRLQVVMATLALSGAASPSATEAASATLIWSHAFTGSVRYAHHLDVAERGASALEFYEGDERFLVTAAGGQSRAAYTPVPIPSLGCSPNVMTIRSPRDQSVVVFGPGAHVEPEGFELPIPSAIRFSSSGSALATYTKVLSRGLLTDDGSTFISFEDGRGSSGDPEDPFGRAMVHDGSGAVIATIVDAAGLFTRGELSADGSLFVYPRRTGAFVGYRRTGDLAFTFPLRDQNVGGEPGIAITPTGSFVAFRAWSTSSGTPGTVLIIDSSGRLILSIPQPRGLAALALADDGSAVLMVTLSSATLVALPSGTTLWTRTLPPGFFYAAADLASATKEVVLVREPLPVENDSSAGQPQPPSLEILSSTGTLLAEPSLSGRTAASNGSPIDSAVLSDDGALLLVAASRSLHLFAISKN